MVNILSSGLFTDLLKKTNLFVLSLLLLVLSSKAIADTKQNQPISVNFRDAEISQVIESVAKLTGKNFIIDSRVRGRVSLIASQPVNSSELYDILLAILNFYGYAAIQGNDLIRIVPTGLAQSIAPKIEGDEDYAMATEVITVNNIAVQQIINVIRPFMNREAQVIPLPDTNKIIVTDSIINLDRVKKLITKVDVLPDRDYQIIKLEHAAIEDVSRIVQTIFKPQGGGTGGYSLETDIRNNSLVLIAPEKLRLSIQALIADLDTPQNSTTQGNIKVFYLRYAKADKLSGVLSSLLSSEAFHKVAPENAANTAANLPNAPKLINKTNAANISSTYSIQADEELNAIIVTGPNHVIQSVETVIKQLDLPRAQVIIEVIIAELSDDKAAELGLDWIYREGNNGLVADITGGISAVAGAATASKAARMAALVGASAGGAATAIGNVRAINTRDGNNNITSTTYEGWLALVRALQSDSRSSVLSTPYMITLDNEEASFSVGDEVPFVTGRGVDNNGNPFNQINRQNVGINLIIKPQVNNGDMIRLDIQSEISNIQANSVGASGIVTNSRKIGTSVLVRDGSIVTLGGLIQKRQIETNKKVPLLGDVPLLGYLFRYQSSSMVNANLVVFMRPRILKGDASVASFSHTKYNLFRSKQFEFDNQESLIPDQSPIIEDLNSKRVIDKIADKTETDEPELSLRDHLMGTD